MTNTELSSKDDQFLLSVEGPRRVHYVVPGVITAAWVIGHGMYMYTQWEEFLKLVPNEWGDYLAGVASVLAFTWLIAGYIQNAKELRQNTYALNLQVRELRQAAEQALRIANVGEEQLRRESEEEIRRAMSDVQARVMVESPFVKVDLTNCGGQPIENLEISWIDVWDNPRATEAFAYLAESETLRYQKISPYEFRKDVNRIEIRYSETVGDKNRMKKEWLVVDGSQLQTASAPHPFSATKEP